MRLMRVGPVGAERPAVWVDEETYVDVSDRFPEFDAAFLASDWLGPLADLVAERVRAGAVATLSGVRIAAPIPRPHQILCIGLNYRDHAAETGQDVPAEPLVFTKAPNSMVGPHDDVWIPPGAEKVDWEVELGVVVGRRCRYLPDEDAGREAIAGYVVVNDVSERAFQLERGGQWVKGKSAETFNPCGPWLVTPDELADIHDLAMWLDVNGIRRQTGNTGTMVFPPAVLVQYLSQFMVLEPGDLINTGTPPGVGLGCRPPVFLRPGDVVELGIAGLGTQRQHVLPAP